MPFAFLTILVFISDMFLQILSLTVRFWTIFTVLTCLLCIYIVSSIRSAAILQSLFSGCQAASRGDIKPSVWHRQAPPPPPPPHPQNNLSYPCPSCQIQQTSLKSSKSPLGKRNTKPASGIKLTSIQKYFPIKRQFQSFHFDMFSE